MPHFIIEHGAALKNEDDHQDAMQVVATAGADCGFILREDIKVRIYESTSFLLLDGRESFLHLTIRMLAGRTAEQKTALSRLAREGLCKRFSHVQSISVEICDMEPQSYKKRLTPLEN